MVATSTLNIVSAPIASKALALKNLAVSIADYSAAIDTLQGISKLHGTYSNCLENPYRADLEYARGTVEIKRDEIAAAVREALESGAGKTAINNRLAEHGMFGFAGDTDAQGRGFMPNTHRGIPVLVVKTGGNDYAFELA